MFWMLLLMVLAGTYCIARHAGRCITFQNDALKALKADCDIDARLTEWRLANPGVAIGKSPAGRQLVLERLAAWRRFLRYHPFITDEGFTEFLLNLLNDRGPENPPSKRRHHPKSRRREAAFLFMLPTLRAIRTLPSSQEGGGCVKRTTGGNRSSERTQEILLCMFRITDKAVSISL